MSLTNRRLVKGLVKEIKLETLIGNTLHQNRPKKKRKQTKHKHAAVTSQKASIAQIGESMGWQP